MRYAADARQRAARVDVDDDEQLGRRSRLSARPDPDVERDASRTTCRRAGRRSPATRASTASDLDLLSAPNRGRGRHAADSRRAAVHLGIVDRALDAQLGERPGDSPAGARHCAAARLYTLAKSMDNTPSLGSGASLVAQNPTGPRRRVGALEFRSASGVHRQPAVSSCRSGPDRRWLSNGGVLAGVDRRLDVGDCVHRAVGARRSPRACAARSSTSRREPTARCART